MKCERNEFTDETKSMTVWTGFKSKSAKSKSMQRARKFVFPRKLSLN